MQLGLLALHGGRASIFLRSSTCVYVYVCVCVFVCVCVRECVVVFVFLFEVGGCV